jgi:magnesium chelatase subunit I
MRDVVTFFNIGGNLKLDESAPSAQLIGELGGVSGLLEKTKYLGLGANEQDAARVAAAEFILEGLYSLRRIGRNEEAGYIAEERRPKEEPQQPRAARRGGYN